MAKLVSDNIYGSVLMRSKDAKELHCRLNLLNVSLGNQHPISVSSNRNYVLLPRGVIGNQQPQMKSI